jgi:hypothetical protein
LGAGFSVEVTKSNRSFLASVASELGNFELYFALYDHFAETVSVSTFCAQFGNPVSAECFSDLALDCLASHFYELPSDFLHGLPLSAVVSILSNHCLKIRDEDSLLGFILDHLETKSEHSELLEFVRLEYLTPAGIGHFIKWTSEHFEGLKLTISLWTRITKRLSLSVTPEQVNDRMQWPGWSFAPKPDCPLEGIIAFLTKKHGGNVQDCGIVEISASHANSQHLARNAADLQQQNYFLASSAPNEWLRYDFKDRRVALTHYSIAAHTSNCFLRSWVVEGSMDGNDNWIMIDSRTNDTEASSSHPIPTFAVGDSEAYRFIRLRQTGKNSRGTDCLILFGFEMFGLLIE